MSLLRNLAAKAACVVTPVKKNRVVFSNCYGRGYADSPKAICEVLRQSGEPLDLVSLCRGEEAARTLPNGVRAVPANGWKKLRALASAGVWVDNDRKYEKLKRKHQFYLQTWHGFPVKKIEKDAEETLSSAYLAACKLDAPQCDLMVAGSGFMEKLFRTSFWYTGPVLKTGTPRNDVLFRDHAEMHAKVCKALGLPEDRKLALYVPAFRETPQPPASQIDAEMVRCKAEEAFQGAWTVVIRPEGDSANRAAASYACDGDRLVDASHYPDLSELLCAAGLFLTDDAECMFDYALTGKPMVRFLPDAETSLRERDCYFPPEDLPFLVAQSNEELEAVLTELQPLWTNSTWAEFAREIDFCEDGEASVRCAALILQAIRG